MLNFSVYKRKIVHTKISDFKKAGNQFKTKGSSAINAVVLKLSAWNLEYLWF